MEPIPRMLSRRTLIAAAALAPAALVGGCSTDQGSNLLSALTNRAQGATEGAYAVAVERPASLDPAACAGTAERQVVSQLFDPLMRYDYASATLAGAAASGFTVSDDAHTFTFTLRDATFHDGSPVRATDVKRAWERLVNPASAAAAAWGPSSAARLLALVEGYDELAAGAAEGLRGIACPDDATFTVTLSTAYADFPYLVAHPALAPVPASAEEDAASFGAAPAGNGPFRMEGAWAEGDAKIALAPFEDYIGGAPALPKAELRVHGGTDEAHRAFANGELDAAPCPIADADAGAASWKGDGAGAAGDLGASAHAACVSGLAVSYLACNMAAAPFDGADARRAVSMAIDRERLAEALYRGTYQPADGLLAPGVRGYRAEAWRYAAYDAAGAADLLDDAYPADGDGKRDLKVGLLYGEDSGTKSVAEAIAADLGALGIDCTPEAVPADELERRLTAGDFQLARLDWTADAPCADAVLYPLLHSAAAGATNVCGFSDADFDALVDEARATVDGDARIDLMRRADELAARACPLIPYAFPARARVGSTRTEKLPVDPTGVLRLAEAEVAG